MLLSYITRHKSSQVVLFSSQVYTIMILLRLFISAFHNIHTMLKNQFHYISHLYLCFSISLNRMRWKIWRKNEIFSCCCELCSWKMKIMKVKYFRYSYTYSTYFLFIWYSIYAHRDYFRIIQGNWWKVNQNEIGEGNWDESVMSQIIIHFIFTT